MVVILFFIVSVWAQTNEMPKCDHDAQNFRCVKFIKNYDGDTLTVTLPQVHSLFGQKIPVRVRGVDTPELGGPLPCEKQAARAAKNLTQNQLKNANRIDLSKIGRDKYFRVLADVIYDGKNLGEIILKNNLAYPYEGKKKLKMDWCKRMGIKPKIAKAQRKNGIHTK